MWQKNVPFDEWFSVEAVQQYHRAMLAETFMQDLAPVVWPQGQRIGFCWLAKPDEQGESYCPMKEGMRTCTQLGFCSLFLTGTRL
jgi:hypothetical protein